MNNYLIYYANDLVERGRQLKTEDSEEAKRCLLEAANIFIRLAQASQSKADFYRTAQALYEEAKELQDKPQIISFTDIKELARKKTSFDDVCGLQNLKDAISLKIVEPFKHPEVFKMFNKKVGGGILMYGPPGCGKTMLAEAAANEAGVTFINVRASDLRSKYVGESEKNIAELFERARQSAPCIIFFDEFEAIGRERSKSAEYGKNEVSQLLIEMNGFSNKEQQILFIAATNEPWDIDIAFRREGRFGTTIFVPPPDFAARYGLFKKLMAGKPAEHLNYSELAKITEGYSSADIVGICERAADIAISDYLKTGCVRKINDKDFYNTLKKSRSSIINWFLLAKNKIEENGAEDLKEDIQNYLSKIENSGTFEKNLCIA